MSLIEVIDPAFLKSKLDLINLSITGLRDALKGTGNKDFTTLEADVEAIYARLDVALSTRLSEAAFTGRWDGGIYGFDGTTARKIKTDSAGELQVDVLTTANPPNLDVALSTRSSESTLSAFSGKFPSATSLGDSLSNPTTTIIGGALLGWDSSSGVWERVYTDGSNRLKVQLDTIPNPPNLDVALSTRLSESTFTSRVPTLSTKSIDISGSSMAGLAVIPSIGGDITRMPYTVDDISVSATEASTSIAAPGAKILRLTNKSDTDILIGLNGSVPVSNPFKLLARTTKVLVHQGVTSVYYKTASGTAILKIEWIN